MKYEVGKLYQSSRPCGFFTKPADLSAGSLMKTFDKNVCMLLLEVKEVDHGDDLILVHLTLMIEGKKYYKEFQRDASASHLRPAEQTLPDISESFLEEVK